MKKKIKLFWYSTVWLENREKENFGDLLSKYIVEKISNRSVKWVYPKFYKSFFLKKKHYLVIGSILSHSNKKSLVWGSGIIEKKEKVKAKKFYAVRGPRTRNRLLELGNNVPKIYGDPALLVSDFYFPKKEKKYKYGVIPHYVDYDDVKTKVKGDKIKVINFLTNNIELVIDDILSCEFIISSSLHGVIVSHSYGIPAIWVKFSEKLFGDDIKFYDYFESVDLMNVSFISLKTKSLTIDLLENLEKKHQDIVLPKRGKIEKLKKSLIESCPFNK